MANESNAKPNKSKDKKPKKRGRIKETFSELKKVTWPSFATVAKQTGIVLAVVVAFLLVLVCFDQLFGFIYGQIVKKIDFDSVNAVTLISALRSTAAGGMALWL